MAAVPAPGEVPEEEREKPPVIDLWGPLRALGELIANAFKGFIDFIAEGLAKFWMRMIPAKEILPKEIYTSLTSSSPEWTIPLINDLVHYYVREASEYISSVVETNPYIDSSVGREVEEKIKTFLLPSAIAMITLSVVSQLAELLHPLRELRVGETVRDVLRAMGVTQLVDSMFRMIYSESLLQPLKYDLNYLVRPWLPPQNIVDTMLFQEGIDEKKWEEYYRRIGWAEEWIDAWRKARYRPPSMWILYRVIENPNIPDEWYDKVLRYHGLDEEDREVLKEVFKWYSLKDEIYRYRDRVVYWYRKGMMSKERLLQELTSLPLSKEVIDYTVALADLEYEFEVLEDKVSTVREGFRKGRVSELEYVNMLRELGVGEERIAVWLELDKLKRKVELRKTVVSLAEVG